MANTASLLDMLRHGECFGVRLGMSKADVVVLVGEPESVSVSGKAPQCLKYGCLQFTLIAGEVCGVGVDLSDMADTLPASLAFSGWHDFRRTSLPGIEVLLGERLEPSGEHSCCLMGQREAFFSFEDGVLYRMGLRRRIDEAG